MSRLVRKKADLNSKFKKRNRKRDALIDKTWPVIFNGSSLGPYEWPTKALNQKCDLLKIQQER